MKLFLVILICVFSSIASQAEETCALHVMKPLDANSAVRKKFVKWLSKTALALNQKYEGARNIYEVDLNNDGKKNLIMTHQHGELSLLYLQIFQEDPEFQFLSENGIPKPADIKEDGYWYSHAYTANGNEELFLQCGNTTALSFQGDYNGERELFVWKGDETKRACNDPWVSFMLDETKKLVDEKKPVMAENNLTQFYNHCEPVFTPEEKLRVLQRLIDFQIGILDRLTCEKYVGLAKAVSGFDSKNLTICDSLKATYDPKVFENAKLHTYDINKLIDVTVPAVTDFEIDRKIMPFVKLASVKGVNGKRFLPFVLREHFRQDLTGSNFDKTMLTTKMVTFTGCKTKECSNKAILWVDSESKKSLFVTNDFDQTPFKNEHDCILIGSRTVTPTTVPDKFWRSFNVFLEKTQLPRDLPLCFFYEKNGKTIFEPLMSHPEE